MFLKETAKEAEFCLGPPSGVMAQGRARTDTGRVDGWMDAGRRGRAVTRDKGINK